MGPFALPRRKILIGGAALLLSGCGGQQSLIGAPGAIPQSRVVAARTSSTNYKVLYSFGAAPGASYPAGLIEVNGKLYGTAGGGRMGCGSPSSPHIRCGTVYRIGVTGSEKVLYAFKGGLASPPDGGGPTASLIDLNGMLYGTTYSGGGYACDRGFTECGTVYRISVTGSEKVLHDFGAGTDGVIPAAGLIDVGGTLYGTTSGGGIYSSNDLDVCANGYPCGTVFSITPGGTENVLHSFGNGTDGQEPLASLIEVSGTLYGTTYLGGVHCQPKGGCGTVFSITPDGTEKVLYSFNGTDGAHPDAALIEVKGTLYGTTYYGGAYHRGTVFSITPSGGEKVLYSFNGTDGAYPAASLIEVKGTLYGTTYNGGAYCRSKGGCGTVFSITLRGTENVLHSFGNGTDGAHPDASLIEVNGTLYGTTSGGGANEDGTVFELSP